MSDITEKLSRVLQTMTNDDTSAAGTREKDRFIERSRLLLEVISLLKEPPPQPQMVAGVPCPCTLIEQDEDCPVGYPSLLCGICEGKGHTTQEQVTALACEMITIASDVGEPEDPFAAWESVSLIQSQRDQLRKALADMVPPKLTWKERDADGFLVHHKVAAINAARAALASASTVNNPATLEKSDFQKFDVEGERQENERETPKQHVCGEPTGYLVKRYDLNGVLLDTELSFTKPIIRSTAKTEFVPLFAALSAQEAEG